MISRERSSSRKLDLPALVFLLLDPQLGFVFSKIYHTLRIAQFLDNFSRTSQYARIFRPSDTSFVEHTALLPRLQRQQYKTLIISLLEKSPFFPGYYFASTHIKTIFNPRRSTQKNLSLFLNTDFLLLILLQQFSLTTPTTCSFSRSR